MIPACVLTLEQDAGLILRLVFDHVHYSNLKGSARVN